MKLFEELKKVKSRPEIPWDCRGPLLYVHLTPIIDAWMEWFYEQENHGFVKRLDVLQAIKKQPGFIQSSVVKKINGHPYRCVVFVRNKAPKALFELLNGKPVDKRTRGR